MQHHTAQGTAHPSTAAATSAAHALRRLLDWMLPLLLAVLPFETTHGIQLPGLVLTYVELLAMGVLGCWGLLLLSEGRLPGVRWLLWPTMFFVALLLLSAALAPHERNAALKFSLRQAQGGALALCVADRIAAAGLTFARRMLAALAVGGFGSGLLGLLEMSEAPAVLGLLNVFKPQLSLVEGMLRLSATFVYANVAAMYYEALLPLALAASLGLLRGRWRLAGVVLGVVLVAAVVLTYSRAALFTSGALLIATPLLVRWRWGRGALSRQALALALGLALLATLMLLVSPRLRLRLSTTDKAAWYSAGFQVAPLQPLQPGELRRVPIQVTNDGQAAWDSAGLRPVMLAYHWYDAKTQALVEFEGLRTPLPRSVAAGETIELLAQLKAPALPGRYLLAWDMLREQGGGWFQQGTAAAATPVAVGETADSATAGLAAPAQVIEVQPPSPPRLVLWGIAMRLWWERPWLGIGPDVFRHVYGQHLGLKRWDTRIHTNSLYLEVLTGAGIWGIVGLATLLGSVLCRSLAALKLRQGAENKEQGTENKEQGAENKERGTENKEQGTENKEHRMRDAEQGMSWWCLVASTLGLAACLIHGFLDAFLAFTATYVLMWCLIGMSAGLVERLFCAVAQKSTK